VSSPPWQYVYCPVLSCRVLPCRVLSYPVLSYPVLSYPILSCPVMLSCPCQPALQLTVSLTANWTFHTLPFINGEWTNPADGSYMSVINPADRQAFHHVASCTDAGSSVAINKKKKLFQLFLVDVKRAVEAANAAFPGWSSTPVAERARLLNAIADKLIEHKQLLGELEVSSHTLPIH